MNDRLMDVKEVADYLKFSTKKVYQLIKKREIPFKKIVGQYRFVKAEIDRWIISENSYRIEEKEEEYLSKNDIKVLLQKARNINDKLKKHLFIIAILTSELKKEKLKPVVVGGFALEFYTTGGYNTGDIDLVFPDNKLLGRVLEKMGFIKIGRHWINKELDIYIEVPGSKLTRGEIEHLVEVEIDGLPVYMIGVEDLIIDRLNAYVYWKSLDEENWIKEMMIINFDKLDWKYLKERSKKEGTDAVLKKFKKESINEKNKL